MEDFNHKGHNDHHTSGKRLKVRDPRALVQLEAVIGHTMRARRSGPLRGLNSCWSPWRSGERGPPEGGLQRGGANASWTGFRRQGKDAEATSR